MSDMIKSTVVNSMGYGIVPKLVMKDKIDIAAKGLYAYFCSYAGAGNTCFPPRDLICSDLGISKDRFTKLLKQLTDKGYIKIEQVKDGGRFAHNVYTIVADTLSPPCPVFPDTVKPDTEIPDTVFPDTENTDINNNSINNNSINNNSNKKNNKKGFGLTVDEYTNNPEMKTAIFDFIEFRKAIKAPLTDRALTLCLNKLDKLANDDNTKIAIINQSIERGWKGLFELHNNTSNYNKPASTVPNESDYNFEIGSFWK